MGEEMPRALFFYPPALSSVATFSSLREKENSFSLRGQYNPVLMHEPVSEQVSPLENNDIGGKKKTQTIKQQQNHKRNQHQNTLPQTKPEKNPICEFLNRFHICCKHAGSEKTSNNVVSWRKYLSLSSDRSLQQLWTCRSKFFSKPSEMLMFTFTIQMKDKENQEQRAHHPIHRDSCLWKDEPYFGNPSLFCPNRQSGCLS